MTAEYDAVVIGSGPNGLVAALTMARQGRRVVVLEAEPTVGGGTRTEALTQPGFLHDVCSAIHPLGLASPALRELDLAGAGVRWVHPDVALAHPLPGRAALLHRSLAETASGLERDGDTWTRLFAPVVDTGLGLVDTLLDPLAVPRHPLALARFGIVGIRGAQQVAAARFRDDQAAALLGGLAAHAILPLRAPVTTGVGLLLGGLAHLVGWPLVEGGSQGIADALVRLLRANGGEVVCNQRVTDWGQLPSARAVLADITPRQFLDVAGDRLPPRYRRRLGRYRYGPGVFKVDWALAGPVPWADPDVARAGTVHVGGTIAEIAAAEAAVAAGQHPEQPFVLVAQQSLFDATRAPAGQHTLWAYCHVPNGSTVDMTDRIEGQIERFAPGFRDQMLARHVMNTAAVQAHNANYIGGDIAAGVGDFRQYLARPVPSLHPWATPLDGVYLCSAATPPGAGVHGMCGRHAARLALRRELRD